VIEIAVFDVSGMHCGSCEQTITNALSEIEGVTDAKASVEQEQAKVKFDPAKVSVEELQAAIEGKGYTVEEIEIIKLEEPAGTPGE
jgi:copper chaperone CopZ